MLEEILKMRDLQQVVFSAVKEGKLKLLKSYLSSKTMSQVKALTSAKIKGTTPLITAAREGHLDIVQYLITRCHADINQCGSVVFDGETIEGAQPLWCSAAAGHFSVVKCLIQHKANPNCTTQTNSTPLRAACFDGHLGIVKYLIEHNADIEIANRHEHTCLMIACYKGHTEIVKTLLEAGANVNRCSVKRNTALHDCAEHGSVAIAKLLLKYNARLQKDSHGMTPLMTAAVAGNVQLTEFFGSLLETTRVEKIQANELLGATYLDKGHDLSRAIMFWKKALELRAIHPSIQYTPKEPVSAYGYVTEPNTLEELEEVRTNPEKSRMIALLIRERVLGPKHPDTSYFIRYRGAVYADSGDFEKCVALWMYALDMQRSNLEPLYPMTLSSLLSLAELFSFMQQNRSHMSSTVPKANHVQIMNVLERAVQEISLGYELLLKNASNEKDKSCISKSPASRPSRPTNIQIPPHQDASYSSASGGASNGRSIGSGMSRRSPSNSVSTCCTLCEVSNQRVYRAMVIILHLTALSEIVFNDKSNNPADKAIIEAKHKRNKLLYQLKSVRDHCNHTLLHLASCARACPLSRYPLTKFPNLEVINVLLKCGYDIDARDGAGKTAAHLAAETARDFEALPIVDVVRHLLDAGAHVDSADKEGSTVLDSLGSTFSSKINCTKYQSLQCLAARVVAKNNFRIDDVLTPDLVRFVQSH